MSSLPKVRYFRIRGWKILGRFNPIINTKAERRRTSWRRNAGHFAGPFFAAIIRGSRVHGFKPFHVRAGVISETMLRLTYWKKFFNAIKKRLRALNGAERYVRHTLPSPPHVRGYAVNELWSAASRFDCGSPILATVRLGLRRENNLGNLGASFSGGGWDLCENTKAVENREGIRSRRRHVPRGVRHRASCYPGGGGFVSCVACFFFFSDRRQCCQC